MKAKVLSSVALTVFVGLCIVLAVLLSSPSSQADAPSSTLNISPVSEVLTGYTASAADETLPTPDNCSGCDSPYLVRRFLYNGEWIDEVIVPGPPQRPIVAESASGIEPQQSYAGDHRLSNVPAFDWCYGCSATSAAMMFGYYDRTSYPDMYSGPTNGGVCPLTNAVWGSGECPLSATHQGYDNLSTKGHVDDYWYSYGSIIDPYWDNWSQHGYADCTADYMGTNQYHNWWNTDGSTRFYYYNDCTPLYDYSGQEGSGYRDGAHGMRLFVESRGYSLYYNSSLGEYTVFNQYIKGYKSCADSGFTYDQYKAEIDAGRPVLIQLEGHTMIGVGYNSSNDYIDIHDTWDYSDHVMRWGGSYEGMKHAGVTVLQMGSVPVTPTPSPTCTGECPTPTPTTTPTPTATPPCGWTVVMTEDFESGFPGTKWNLSGNPTWDDESYRSYNGIYSAWCAGSTLTPPDDKYAKNMDARMVYGPFNLSDAFYADVKFQCWLYSQSGHDYFEWMASPDGSSYYGYQTSGYSGGWFNVTFNFTNVSTYGNMCGDPDVWLMFRFTSDNALQYEGAYVDDIVLGKNVSCPTPTPSPTPTVSPTVSPTISPTVSPTVSPTLSPTVSPTISPTSSPTPTVSPTVTPTPTEPPMSYGDVNRDGGITTTDRGWLNQMLMLTRALDPIADVSMDGRITTTDRAYLNQILLLTRTPVSMMEAIYDSSSGAGSDRWAKSNNVTAPPPALNTTFDTDPTGWVEATSGQYTNISAGNGDVWTIAGVSGNYTALQCKFTVAEGAYAGNITSIGVTFNGSSQDSGDLLQLWAWNFNTSAWTQVGSDVSLGNASNQAYIKWTAWGKVFDDYIDASNYMYILYAHDTPGKYLNVDYVKLEIISPE